MGAGLDGLVHRHFDVPQVVEGVEDADDVNAVFHALAHESPDDVIGIVLVSQQVLAAQQHLQLGVLYHFADLAQALPGIFM